jgi:uncharacterized membrane protein
MILLLTNRNENEILVAEDKHGRLRHAILFENIRTRLARVLLRGLYFKMGSDILKTVLDPSFTELTIHLSMIAGVRIVLRFN